MRSTLRPPPDSWLRNYTYDLPGTSRLDLDLDSLSPRTFRQACLRFRYEHGLRRYIQPQRFYTRANSSCVIRLIKKVQLYGFYVSIMTRAKISLLLNKGKKACLNRSRNVNEKGIKNFKILTWLPIVPKTRPLNPRDWIIYCLTISPLFSLDFPTTKYPEIIKWTYLSTIWFRNHSVST